MQYNVVILSSQFPSRTCSSISFISFKRMWNNGFFESKLQQQIKKVAGRRDLQSKDEFFGLGALLEQSLLIDFDLKEELNCIKRRRLGFCLQDASYENL